jgi:hypothetical protein
MRFKRVLAGIGQRGRPAGDFLFFVSLARVAIRFNFLKCGLERLAEIEVDRREGLWGWLRRRGGDCFRCFVAGE